MISRKTRLSNYNTLSSRIGFSAAAVLAFFFICCSAGKEKTYYAIEISGNLVGYSETVSSLDPASGTLLKTDTQSLLLLTLLGQPFNMETREVCRYDPETQDMIEYDADIRAGQMHTGSTVRIEGQSVKFIPKPEGKASDLILESDVQTNEFQLTELFGRELGEKVLMEKTYRLLDPTRGRILERTYTYLGEENLVTGEVTYFCRVFGLRDRTLGLSGKVWLDRENGQPVRTHLSNDTTTYLTDAGVRNRIRRGNMDNRILAKVDAQIPDHQRISRMKVRAIIQSAGEALSPTALNGTGQRFEGTVEDNRIEGVFDIEHVRYDGSGAPPFPSNGFAGNPDLIPYLEPELMIESDDPVLIQKAKELTEGANDSWEAVRLLARWVGMEIAGAIPGGSARQTYDTRKGECGAHSRLFAAFCRAVGIPSRMVMGGVYFYDKGGVFGQHGWNEVYMGEAGWIPLDTTFKEFDYCDSSHIRLGYLTTFQPIELEVLEYETGISNQ